MNFRLQTRPFFICLCLILAFMVSPAGAGNLAVIHEVVTESQEGASSIIIRLIGHPAFKVIPIEEKEMLIAFKDTEFSGDIRVPETFARDELIEGLTLEHKPCRVSCLVVKLGKPYADIKCRIKEVNGGLHIEIKSKAGDVKQEEIVGIEDRLLKVESKAASADAVLFTEATAHYRRGKWEKATRNLRKIIECYPESAYLEQVYFLLAKSFHRMFDEEVSRHLIDITSLYQDAISKFPESDYVADAMVSIGNCYFQVKNYYEALAYYNAVLKKNKKDPAVPEALFQRGRVLVLLKKPTEAVSSFEELERRNPGTELATRGKLEKAKALFDMKAFKRCLATLQEIMAEKPGEVYKTPELLLYAGYSYYELGQLKEARDTLTEVLNYFPKMKSNHIVLTKIADTYSEEGVKSKACKLYRLAVRMYPGSEGALISLLRLADESEKAIPGNDRSRDGMLITGKTAREIYEDIIEKHPDSPLFDLVMLKLAILHHKNKDYDQSIATLQKLLAKHPQTPLKEEIKVAMAKSFKAIVERETEAGTPENAIAYCEQLQSVLRIDDMPDLLLLVGDTYRRLCMYLQALSAFQKARRFYSEGDEPACLLFGLGESFYMVNRFDKAEPILKAFLVKYPEHKGASAAYYLLGNILVQRKEYREALQSFNMALQQKPDPHHQVKVLMGVANVLTNQGKHGKAVSYFKRAIALITKNKAGSSEDLYIAYRELGESYLAVGGMKKAVTAFENALELNPKDFRAPGLQFRLAQCYHRLKATDKAQEMWNGVLSSGDPFWSDMARVELKQIQVEESLGKIRDSLAGSSPAKAAL